MTRTTMGNLINLSVKTIRSATDLLERSPLDFIPDFFSEKRPVVSDIESSAQSSLEDGFLNSFEDEDIPSLSNSVNSIDKTVKAPH